MLNVVKLFSKPYLGELYAIYIPKPYQRQGIGRSLTSTVVKRLAQENIFSMLVWVLSDNPACEFYETLGGQQIYSQQIERGGVKLNEVAYGWVDTNCVTSSYTNSKSIV